jgi:putative membrane protein
MPFPYRYGGPFWLHDLFFFLVVIAIIVGIYVLVRGFTLRSRPWWGPPDPRLHDGPRGRGGSPAIEELDLRYARGELDRIEYLQRRADLLGEAPPPEPGPAPPARPSPKS